MSNNDKLDKAVIYARTASTEGTNKSDCIINQIKKCNEYAEKHNFKIDLVFSDVGVSDSVPLKNREELKKAVAYCRLNKIDKIIVDNHERISRNGLYYTQIRAEIENKGINILPERKISDVLISNFASAMFEFENNARAKELNQKMIIEK